MKYQIELFSWSKEVVKSTSFVNNISFEKILKKYEYLMLENEISFHYQRSDAKRGGAAVKKIKNDKIFYEIRIKKNTTDEDKINIFFHELAHILLKHHEKSILNSKHKEFIVDTIAEVYLKKYKNITYYKLKSNNSWDQSKYRWEYIKNTKINKNQKKEIIKQIKKIENLF